ncbi:MAG: thioredoxin family protein [Planctomycetota bacterium]|nr:MAG: thioredoxin family protein [Planctomycetota bacterium]
MRAAGASRTLLADTLLYVALLAVVGALGTAAVLKSIAASEDLLHYLAAAGEFLVIGLLIFFHRRWWAWVGVGALFAAFAGYTAFLVARGESSCGCFGDVQTPPTFTLSLDIGLAILAGLVAATRAGSASIVGGVLTLAGVAAAVGAGFGVLTHDPLPTEYKGDRAAVLLTAPTLAEAAHADLTGPDTLVYLYDPGTAETDETLALLRADAKQHADDATLRVVLMPVDQAEAEAGVPAWAWERLPAAILYRGGRAVQRYVAQTLPDPQTLRAQRPVGPIAQVLSLPEHADILYAEGDLPVYLVYVYNPDCPICLQHLAVFDEYSDEWPDDPYAVVTPVSMHEIEDRLGIQIWAWPGIPTTYVVRGGRVVGQTAGPELIPNPYQIRQDLAMGRPLRLPEPGGDGHAH